MEETVQVNVLGYVHRHAQVLVEQDVEVVLIAVRVNVAEDVAHLVRIIALAHVADVGGVVVIVDRYEKDCESYCWMARGHG